uniref:ABC transporter domain-containing protein n=1 Tax=Arcella intermedia TaxID=1963864 RepID=A0A6B2L7V7_9EUKA
MRGVSMNVKKGEFVIIFGLSGGGKTTLLNVIGTIDKPTKGELYLCGHRIDSNTTDDTLSFLRLKKIGFVFQTFNLLSSLTALENVEMPMILAGELSAEERRKRAIELLTKVGMGERLNHVPSQLSGGEQQRVTIARAVANRPEILLLDEPTGDLDSMNTCIVLKQLLQLNEEEKITLIMVTHDVGIKNFSHRVIWMRDGKIQNVEPISKRRRNTRIQELDEEYELLKKGIRQQHVPFKNTTIRSPNDYDTNPLYEKKAPKHFKFSEKYKTLPETIPLDDYEDHPKHKTTSKASQAQLVINIDSDHPEEDPEEEDQSTKPKAKGLKDRLFNKKTTQESEVLININ